MAPFWLACGLLTASISATEHAPPAAVTTPTTAPPQVVVGLAGAAAPFRDDALLKVLAGYLADLDPPRAPIVLPLPPGDEVLPQIAWARARAEPPVERVLWLELRTPGPHRLYLYDPKADRVYLRELDDAEPDLMLETIGVVVRSLVASLSEGTPPGMQPLELPAPEPPPTLAPPIQIAAPPPSPPPPRLHLDLALGYRGSTFSAAIPTQHGLAAQLLIITPRGLLAGLSAGYLASGTAPERADLSLTLPRINLAARLGYRFLRDRPFHLDLDLGLTTDLLLPRVRGPAEPRTTLAARVGLSPGLGLGVRPFARVPIGLHLHLQLDLWLRDLAFAAQTPGGAVLLADAARLGGTLDLALRYTFGAGHKFSSTRRARGHLGQRACSPSSRR